jgi:mannose-6-phosphate isomerase-like protein (cupin superfamily)
VIRPAPRSTPSARWAVFGATPGCVATSRTELPTTHRAPSTAGVAARTSSAHHAVDPSARRTPQPPHRRSRRPAKRRWRQAGGPSARRTTRPVVSRFGERPARHPNARADPQHLSGFVDRQQRRVAIDSSQHLDAAHTATYDDVIRLINPLPLACQRVVAGREVTEGNSGPCASLGATERHESCDEFHIVCTGSARVIDRREDVAMGRPRCSRPPAGQRSPFVRSCAAPPEWKVLALVSVPSRVAVVHLGQRAKASAAPSRRCAYSRPDGRASGGR